MPEHRKSLVSVLRTVDIAVEEALVMVAAEVVEVTTGESINLYFDSLVRLLIFMVNLILYSSSQNKISKKIINKPQIQ